MSTKSHFLYENGLEGYEECNEHKEIFGRHIGFNIYLYIDYEKIESFIFKDSFLNIKTKETEHLPKHFRIWGGCILSSEYDSDGLCIHIEGGYHADKIIKLDFDIVP